MNLLGAIIDRTIQKKLNYKIGRSVEHIKYIMPSTNMATPNKFIRFIGPEIKI